MTGQIDRHPLAPWAGLFLGAAAWIGHQQSAAAAIFWDCRLGGPLLTGGLGLLFGLIAALGGAVSWRAHKAASRAEDAPAHNRSVAGMIGAGAAGMFLLAIAFQSLTGFVVPACHR